MTGTIPLFLTTCFPELNELDLSYNQVRAIGAHVMASDIWQTRFKQCGLVFSQLEV